MSTFLQAERPLRVSTPLPTDTLLIVGFMGQEAISRPFEFHLELLAENGLPVTFEKLLGNKVTTHLTAADGTIRHFSGICSEVSEGARDEAFTQYRMVVVPLFWLLCRRAQSRIFQQKTVPDILKAVLEGLDVDFELRGAYEPRDYCVQYRETDLNFAARLMEEEGIFYFFRHSETGHRMVVADSTGSHVDLPGGARVIFEELIGGLRDDDRIVTWEKTHGLRSGKVTLWDHHFELPHKKLEATTSIVDSVAAGKVTHPLKVGGNDRLELYDFPGEYAQRFDGVQPGGGDRAADLQKIFNDNRRTVSLRMQEEAAHGLVIHGSSNHRQLVSGFRFTLERHFNADGQYLLTSITHTARMSGYRSDLAVPFEYRNSFTCIPLALPFRPPRVTRKPVVQGTQTAVVVGPAGEEIFTDKYGRVKIQLHWDRESQANEESSCWVRVAQPVAGKQWGALYIPRVGQEVIVAFEEGDPDRPIIVGSVYNASEMPPYTLDEHKTRTVLIKSNSTPNGTGFNEIRIEDKKGKEQIFIHGERNVDVRIKADHFEAIGHESHHIIEKDHLVKVKKDRHDHVLMDENREVGGTRSLTVGMDQQEKVGMNHALEAGMGIHLKAGMSIVVEAGMQITLKVGGNFIDINPAGIFIQGTMVFINSGGAAGVGAGSNPTAPKDPLEADDAVGGKKSEPPPKNRPPKAATLSPAAAVLKKASQNGTPFCEVCQR